MTTRKKSSRKAEPAADALLHGTPKNTPHAPDVKVKPRTWTRKDAEAYVRSKALRCRGPRNQDVRPVLESLLNNNAAAFKAAARQEIRNPAYESLLDRRGLALKELQSEKVTTTNRAISLLLERNERDVAGLLDAATRAGCGYDMSQQINALPFDGSEHEAPCPKCGVEKHWRQPVFDGLNEAKKGGTK